MQKPGLCLEPLGLDAVSLSLPRYCSLGCLPYQTCGQCFQQGASIIFTHSLLERTADLHAVLLQSCHHRGIQKTQFLVHNSILYPWSSAYPFVVKSNPE